MNPNQPSNQTPIEPYNPLSVMQPGEQVLCEIKRHPIGLLATYVVCGLLILLILGGTLFGLPFLGSDGPTDLRFWSVVSAALLSALVLLYAYIATRIYNSNRWIVTTDSVTQVGQSGLFANQSSQLPMENLEDITVNQRGVLAHIFGYGTLRAQTAGEEGKFSFQFCPEPNKYAQIVLGARERFELSRNDGPGLPGHSNRPSANHHSH